MRWLWIDRYEEFVRGRRAVATKAVSLAEDHLQEHFPGVPVMPNSLVLEGLAQAAGLLVADALRFTRQVVLAKVGRAEFAFEALPGDVLRYEVELVECGADGSVCRGTSRVRDEVQCDAELFFGHLAPGGDLPAAFAADELILWLDRLHIFDVGIDEQGVRPGRDPAAWLGRSLD